MRRFCRRCRISPWESEEAETNSFYRRPAVERGFRMPSVFVTGASGCVGHYLVDALSPDYDLYLLVRNPAKLRFDPAQRKNVTVVPGDLDSIADHASLLARMDYCIHAATAWGGEGIYRINVDRVHQLFNLLSPERTRRIIYFSTASILGRGNVLLPEAGQVGTDYIKSKYLCYTGLDQCRLRSRIVTVFPTLVFGGDATHPFSHLTSALPLFRRYAWLVGRLDVKVAFHYIHAEDIARLVRYLLEAPTVQQGYVLGNDPITFGEFSRRAARFFGHRIGWHIPVSARSLARWADWLGVRLSPWDRFCANYGDFRYETLSCPAVGLPSRHTTVEEIVSDWRLVPAGTAQPNT